MNTMNTDENVKMQVVFRCPFCGGAGAIKTGLGGNGYYVTYAHDEGCILQHHSFGPFMTEEIAMKKATIVDNK